MSPLYVYLLSLFVRHTETGILVTRLVTLAFGPGCVWLIFEIGRRVGNPVTGFVAALLLAISPFFAQYAFFVRMEVRWCLLSWLALSFCLRATAAGEPRWS